MPEQRGIVGVLGVVDSAIELADQVIAKTERLKKGLMQQLLTHGIGHTEYKNTPIGKIPNEWDLVKFGDYVELRHGYQFRTYDYVKKGIKVLKIEQLQANGGVNLTNCSYVANSRLDEFRDVLVEKGDILMALTGGTLGKVARVKIDIPPVLQNYRVGKFVVRDEGKLSKSYLYHVLTSASFLQQIFSKVNKAAQPNIGKADFDNIMLPLPDKYEQQRILEILNTLEEKIRLEQRQKKTLQKIREGLMDLLLTGKVRIKVD
jgi:type I restriction enzyme S subunit